MVGIGARSPGANWDCACGREPEHGSAGLNDGALGHEIAQDHCGKPGWLATAVKRAISWDCGNGGKRRAAGMKRTLVGIEMITAECARRILLLPIERATLSARGDGRVASRRWKEHCDWRTCRLILENRSTILYVGKFAGRSAKARVVETPFYKRLGIENGRTKLDNLD